jgi:hypothetical protein
VSFLGRLLSLRVRLGRADEGGDVFGGLAGELGQDAGVGVGGDVAQVSRMGGRPAR